MESQNLQNILIIEEEIKNHEIFTFPDFSKNLEKLKKNLQRTKVSILLFGETSAGKTTFANLLCSYREKNSDYPFLKEFKILPEHRDENTLFFWVIESSDDNNFLIEKNDKLILKTSDYNAVSEIVGQYQKEQMKLIPAKKGNLTPEMKKVIKVKVPDNDWIKFYSELKEEKK